MHKAPLIVVEAPWNFHFIGCQFSSIPLSRRMKWYKKTPKVETGETKDYCLPTTLVFQHATLATEPSLRKVHEPVFNPLGLSSSRYAFTYFFHSCIHAKLGIWSRCNNPWSSMLIVSFYQFSFPLISHHPPRFSILVPRPISILDQYSTVMYPFFFVNEF